MTAVLGGRVPRVNLWPADRVATDGPIAVQLAARAGMDMLPWQCDSLDLMLSVQRNGRWSCREYCEWVVRQNGKTAAVIVRMLYGFLLLGEKMIVYSAHEDRTAAKTFGQVCEMLAALGERFERRGSEHYRIGDTVVKVNNTNGQRAFEIPATRQQMLFTSRSKGAMRGFSVDGLLVIDEAFAYTFAMQDATRPTLRAKPRSQIIYLSSPPLSGVSGEVMYKLRERSENPAPGRLGYRDFGLAEDLDEILDQPNVVEWLGDRDRWAATNPSYGAFVEEGDMQDDLLSTSAEGFARELLGAWPKQLAANGGVIQQHEWDDLKDVASIIVGTVHIGIDAAPFGRWSTIAAAGVRADGRLHVEIARHTRGMADTPAAVKRMVDQLGGDAGYVCIDPHSPAGAMVSQLKANGVELRELSTTELAQATGLFVDQAVSDGLRHLNQRELTDAVLGGKLRAMGDANVWARRDPSVVISPAVAVCVALAGVVADKPTESVTPWAYAEDEDYDDDEEATW